MPTASISYTAETINGTVFAGTITDGSTYTSPARDPGFANYLYVNKIDQNGAVASNPTITTYDPLTAMTYTFAIETDGYYQFKFVIIPRYDAAVNYNLYDVVYNGGVVYKCIVETPSSGIAPPNPSYWSALSNPTTAIDSVGTSQASANLVYQVYERVIYPFSKVAYGDASEAAALECCSDCERGEDVKTYEMLGVMIDGMNAADQRGKYTKGEKIARKVQEIINA